MEKHFIKFMKTTLPRLAHWQRALFVGRHASIYFRFHFYGLIIWRVFFSCFFFGKCVTFHIWCLSIKHLLFIDLSSNSNFASKNHTKNSSFSRYDSVYDVWRLRVYPNEIQLRNDTVQLFARAKCVCFSVSFFYFYFVFFYELK